MDEKKIVNNGKMERVFFRSLFGGMVCMCVSLILSMGFINYTTSELSQDKIPLRGWILFLCITSVHFLIFAIPRIKINCICLRFT